jgi:O-antigen/teichoic acid export membrane protein
MLIVLTFVLNAGMNFLLGLVVAAILGPELYGRFSIAFMAATIATTLMFDWLRLSATRYYTERARVEEPGVRATLNASYAAGSLVVIVLAAAVLAFDLDVGLSRGLVAAAGFVAISVGFFEFVAALLRARFRNGAYSALVITKNVLAFAGMAGVGLATHDPALVMVMAGASALVATLMLWRLAADPHARLPHASRTQIAVYLTYGAPIVFANIGYQAIVLVNRGAVAAHLDFAAAGRLSLATDLTIRLILVVGAALDIFLFQLAVHKKATEGAAAAQAQIKRNILIILSVLTLLCLGYMAALPAFAALVAPEKFRADFAPLSLILTPGVTLFSLGQFCLNPIAQLEGKTGGIFIAAFATLAIDLALLWLAPQPLALTTYAAIHSLSLAAGFFIMLAMTLRCRAYYPPLRELGVVALAGAGAMAVMWPLRALQPPLLALVLVVLAGAAVFGSVLFAFDLGGFIRPACARIGLSRRRPENCDAQPLGKGKQA